MICQQELQSMFLLHTSCSKVWCNSWHHFLPFHAWQQWKWCTHGTLPPPPQSTCTEQGYCGARLRTQTHRDQHEQNWARAGTAVQKGIVVLRAMWKQAAKPAAPWSVLQATAASTHVPRMLNFKRCLSTNTSLMSVLYFPVLSSVKSCTAFRKPAGYFLLTSVGSELCPCWVVLQWQPLEEQWQNSF